MARPILVAGNWKMNTDLGAAKDLAGAVAAVRSELPASPAFEVACIPPYPWLLAVGGKLDGSGVHLGAQNIAPENNGAWTGDVSGEMIKSTGARYVVIGHSERREYHGEGEPLLVRKIARAREHNLTPIICVGEPLQVRQRGSHESFVREQVLGLFDGLAKDASGWDDFVVAYEPIWAIGTGEVATADQARAMCQMIRETLVGLREEWRDIPILYGGSVKPGNAAELISQDDVDGFLVGGASLDADAFISICRSAAAAV